MKKTIIRLIFATLVVAGVTCSLSILTHPAQVPQSSSVVETAQETPDNVERVVYKPQSTSTPAPTVEPTATPAPTPVPTVEPTPEPTVEPTVEPVQEEVVEMPDYNADDLTILALIIYQEAGGDGCSDSTRQMVGSVFLNRVNSPAFPDTFYEVATAPMQYGTLSYKGIVWPERSQYEGEQAAVQRAYRIAEELLTSGSILPSNVVWQAEFPQGTGTYCFQDNLYFCY